MPTLQSVGHGDGLTRDFILYRKHQEQGMVLMMTGNYLNIYLENLVLSFANATPNFLTFLNILFLILILPIVYFCY